MNSVHVIVGLMSNILFMGNILLIANILLIGNIQMNSVQSLISFQFMNLFMSVIGILSE